MRRTQGLARTPFKRPAPVPLDGARASRKARIINPVSDKMREHREASKPVRDQWLVDHPECEFREAPVPCFGPIHVDEVWPRGQGGPIDDPRNFATACNRHNEWKQQGKGGRAWAIAHGLLVRKGDGARWLAAGGRLAAA